MPTRSGKSNYDQPRLRPTATQPSLNSSAAKPRLELARGIDQKNAAEAKQREFYLKRAKETAVVCGGHTRRIPVKGPIDAN